MSILISTVCNNEFTKACLVMLSTLSKKLKCFDDCDVKVFYEDQICQLALRKQHKISKICPKVKFEHVSNSMYYHLDTRADGYKSSYLSLESFAQEEYDKVVFIDADTFILQDFTDILEMDYDIMACEAGLISSATITGPVVQIPYVNTGFMVIGKTLINPDIYDGLLNSAMKIRRAEAFSDQEALNLYFEEKDINGYVLPFEYNWRQPARFPITKDVKIIHFSSRPKPWGKNAPLDNPAFKMWHDENKEIRKILNS